MKSEKARERTASPGELADCDRVTSAGVPPVDVTLGETSLRFEEGEWTVTGTPGASQPLRVKDSEPEVARLQGANKTLCGENTALRGEVNLLKFKIELLVDMLTLANLDCDALADELHPEQCDEKASVQ